MLVVFLSLNMDGYFYVFWVGWSVHVPEGAFAG